MWKNPSSQESIHSLGRHPDLCKMDKGKNVLCLIMQWKPAPSSFYGCGPFLLPTSIHTYTHHDGLWFELWTRINSLSLLASVRAFYHSDRKRNRYITKLCQESQLHVSKFLNFCLSFCFSAQKNANSFWFCLCLRISKARFFFSFSLVKWQFPTTWPGEHPPYIESASVAACWSWKRKLRTRGMCCVSRVLRSQEEWTQHMNLHKL